MALAAGALGLTIAATSTVWAGHQIEIKDFDVLLYRQGVTGFPVADESLQVSYCSDLILKAAGNAPIFDDVTVQNSINDWNTFIDANPVNSD